MDGKFDEDGNLMIRRGGSWRHVFCYALDSAFLKEEPCKDSCSRLSEPVRDKAGWVLPMCNKVAHFRSFEDERAVEEDPAE